MDWVPYVVILISMILFPSVKNFEYLIDFYFQKTDIWIIIFIKISIIGVCEWLLKRISY